MSAHGVPVEHILFSVDEQGADIELYYFLQTPTAMRWIASKPVALLSGSAPHSLYNDDVNVLFEQRAALVLPDGWLLTHALPERGIYLFDFPGVMERLGRQPKTDAYRVWCRGLIDDLHAVWLRQGSPEVSDDRNRTDVVEILRARLGVKMLEFDETGAVPPPPALNGVEPGVAFARYLQDVIRDRDRRFVEVLDHLGAVERDRDRILAERNAAVNARDRMIDDLHVRLESPLRRARRWLLGR